jgi:hypothetical protein
MENWIGAYRLPTQLGLGVDRNGESMDAGGGVSPIPGSTPSPGLINMWSNAIKVEANAQHQQHSMSTPGSIKGKGRQYFKFLTFVIIYFHKITYAQLQDTNLCFPKFLIFLKLIWFTKWS